MGLVGSMDLTDNMMIRSYKEGRHFFADRKSPKKLAEDIVEKLDVVTPGVDTRSADFPVVMYRKFLSAVRLQAIRPC